MLATDINDRHVTDNATDPRCADFTFTFTFNAETSSFQRTWFGNLKFEFAFNPISSFLDGYFIMLQRNNSESSYVIRMVNISLVYCYILLLSALLYSLRVSKPIVRSVVLVVRVCWSLCVGRSTRCEYGVALTCT